ncbi:hypothetical protein WJX72_003928 [[Myrmecia] bisecta]|uniref:Uncharacterized protein n=1 Tax=[Myrmecia] bisecta TaxID=41462 RepID=A0AAW1P1F3_9CHLO
MLVRNTLMRFKAQCRASAPRSEAGSLQDLRRQLQKLDGCLAKEGPEAEAEAVQLAEQLKQSGMLRGFAGAHQVPKRAYTLEELRLNRVEPEKYLSPVDNTLNNVRTIVQAGGLAGIAALYFGLHLDGSQLLGVVVAILFALTADQVANGGGFEALVIDTAGRLLNRTYANRVAFHEAGHFLVAYLLGLLPRRYTLSSLDAFRRYNALNVQAGTQFCDSAFQAEVASGSLSSSSLDKYCCIALAGVTTEYLTFGQAEGGRNDVQQLDSMLQALRFTQAKADSQVRWAVLNVTSLLRKHAKTHAALAKAMDRGESVGSCIAVVEESLSTLRDDDI